MMRTLHLVPPELPRSLIFAVAVSMALHAALLSGFVRPHLNSGLAAPVRQLQARLVLQSAVSAAQPDASPPAAVAPTTAPTAAALAAPELHAQRAAPSVPAVAPPPSVPPEETRKPGLQPAPDYRSALGLDPPPLPLQSIEPQYPASAHLQEGTVVLRLLISASGDLDEVAVVRATPPGVFDQSALLAFGKAKFSPGYFMGIPVKSQLLIEVGYTPINRGGAVSGQNR